MKQVLQFGGTIFLSYLVLTTGVQEQTYQKGRKNDYQTNISRHVNKTILTEFGEVFDCIDINQQPAFDHPLLKNHVLQMKPSSYPAGFPFQSSSVANTTESQLRRIPCPARTIPILRNNKATLVPPLIFSPDDRGQMAILNTEGELYGATASMNIYEPEVKGNEDVSASILNVLHGEPEGSIEGVGAGTMVSRVFGDNFARFHIFWVESRHKSCFDFQCPGFVQIGERIGLGERITPVSTYNGKQVKISFLVFQDPRTKDWWLIYDNFSIGYWPSALFTDLTENANMAFAGGYVFGPTIESNMPQMGSGHFAEEGERKAAYVRDMKIVDKENRFADVDPDKTFARSSKPACYSVAAYDHNSDGAHVFYGGPGGCAMN